LGVVRAHVHLAPRHRRRGEDAAARGPRPQRRARRRLARTARRPRRVDGLVLAVVRADGHHAPRHRRRGAHDQAGRCPPPQPPATAGDDRTCSPVSAAQAWARLATLAVVIVFSDGLAPEWALSKRNWGQLGATPEVVVLSTRLTAPTPTIPSHARRRLNRM